MLIQNYIKKLFIITIGLLFGVNAIAFSSEYDFEVDHIYYSVVSYDDMTCEVVPGKDNYDYANNIEIPSTITYDNSVYTVISIGDYAFYSCKGLHAVTIPSSVTSIGRCAFEYCTWLPSIIIPESVTFIGEDAFASCERLSSVIIPSTVTRIEDGTFMWCERLTSVSIPNMVTYIGESAFYKCRLLNSVVIPNSVTTMGSEVFAGCTSLQTAHLSENLDSIREALFDGCEKLESITIPGSVRILEQGSYDQWDGYLRTTFSGCYNLRDLSIVFSPEVLDIGYYAPYDGGYKSAGKFNMKETYNLYIDRKISCNIYVPEIKTLLLGEHVDEVQVDDMQNLRQLKSIDCRALEPPVLQELTATQYNNILVTVPEESIEAYRAHPVWGQFKCLQEYSEIEEVKAVQEKAITGRFDISGTPVDENFKGLVIVRFSDGTAKKVLQK